MYRLLQEALLKHADHERMIFADVNLPPDTKPAFQQDWHQEVMTTLNQLEQKQRPADPWPQAMIFFTNRKTSPWPGKSENRSATVLLTGINHPMLKIEDRAPFEKEYLEIGSLFRAASNLSVPPAHFVEA